MHLAVQLYTLRHRLEQDLEGTLAQLAEAGVVEVELSPDKMPADWGLDRRPGRPPERGERAVAKTGIMRHG